MRRYLKNLLKETLYEVIEEELGTALNDILKEIRRTGYNMSIVCDPSHFIGRIEKIIQDSLDKKK